MAATSENRIFASPLARRIAAEKGIDLKTVRGSGPRGCIIRADLDGAKGGMKAPASPVAANAQKAAPAASGPGAKALADAYGMEYTEQANSGVRKVIARRLLESKQTVPHF